MIQWSEGNAHLGLMLKSPNFTDDMFFKEPVEGGAPFLVSISGEEVEVEPNEVVGVMIDDERVLLARFNDDFESPSIDIYTI